MMSEAQKCRTNLANHIPFQVNCIIKNLAEKTYFVITSYLKQLIFFCVEYYNI